MDTCEATSAGDATLSFENALLWSPLGTGYIS
jgi:hypothetical protein